MKKSAYKRTTNRKMEKALWLLRDEGWICVSLQNHRCLKTSVRRMERRLEKTKVRNGEYSV